MGLQVFWFIVIAFFWTGFFILEGFDMGVGALHMVVGKTDLERRVAINSIGPFWDGNEVWLIVAGAGTFAAFPPVVRQHVLGPVPGHDAGAAGPHHPGRVVRVPGQVDEPTVAGHLGLDAHHRQPACSRCCSASRSGTCSHGLPINKEGNYTGIVPRPVYCLWRLGRGHPAGVDAGPRCHLPEPEDHGRGAAARPAPGRPLRVGGGACSSLGFFIWTHVLSNRGVLPNPIQIIAFLLAVGAAWAVRDGYTRVGVRGHQRRPSPPP